jgi:methyl-accepting chemotaxis protein
MYKLIIAVLIIILLILGQKYKAQKAENEQLSGLVDEYSDSLRQANDNIEEANSYIEDAQGYAWSSYQEMGEALENLTAVDTISEP